MLRTARRYRATVPRAGLDMSQDLLRAAASIALPITAAMASAIDRPLSTSVGHLRVTDAPDYDTAAKRLTADHPLSKLGPSDRKLALDRWEPVQLPNRPLIAVAWPPLARRRSDPVA